MLFEKSISFAKQLDEKDPLKDFRDRFNIPEEQGKTKNLFPRKLSRPSTQINQR